MGSKTLTLKARNLARLDNTKLDEVRFRLPYWMKEDLQLYCDHRDIPMSRVLRRLVKDLLADNPDLGE